MTCVADLETESELESGSDGVADLHDERSDLDVEASWAGGRQAVTCAALASNQLNVEFARPWHCCMCDTRCGPARGSNDIRVKVSVLPNLPPNAKRLLDHLRTNQAGAQAAAVFGLRVKISNVNKL